MDLELDLLRSFLAILRYGGFTRAAGALCKTQSTVSLHIRRLEQVVGRPLFRRRGREVVLTEHGETLRAYAEALVGLNDEALLRLRGPGLRGRVRLGLLEDFATKVLPIALRRFIDAYPEIRLDVRCALTAELLRDLEEGALDLVVARRRDGVTEGRALWREPLLWVGARHRRFMSDPLPLVMFPAGCAYRPDVLARLRDSARAWEIVYTSTSLAGVQAAVAAGVGVTVLGRSAALSDFAVLGAPDALPDLPETEIALFSAAESEEAVAALSDYLIRAVPLALTSPPA